MVRAMGCQSVAPSSSTYVEDRANDFVGCFLERWLRFPDVPWCLSGVGANKVFTILAGVGHNEALSSALTKPRP